MAAGPPVSKRPRDGCGAAATGEVVGQAPGTSPSPPPWDALGRHHRPASFVCVAAAVDEQRGGRETAALNEAGRRRGGDAGRFATPALPPLQRTRSRSWTRLREALGSVARGQGRAAAAVKAAAGKAAANVRQPRRRRREALFPPAPVASAFAAQLLMLSFYCRRSYCCSCGSCGCGRFLLLRPFSLLL